MTDTASEVRFELSTRRPVDLAPTLSPLRRGRFDPCHRREPDGSVWRTSLLPSGAVTYRLRQQGPSVVEARAWGPGAEELETYLPGLVGEDDAGRSDEFAPAHPKLAEGTAAFRTCGSYATAG